MAKAASGALAAARCPPQTAAVELPAYTLGVRHDDQDPAWPDRDRVFTETAPPPGSPGIHAAGAPGFALGLGLGAALAERWLAGRFGRSLVDHVTFVLADAASLGSGLAFEAARTAGTESLGRLVAVASGPADARLRPVYAGEGWRVSAVPPDASAEHWQAALDGARASRRPTLLLASGPVPALAGHPRRGVSARRAWLKRLRAHPQRDTFLSAAGGGAATRPIAAGSDDCAPAVGALAAPVGFAESELARRAASLPDLVFLAGDDGDFGAAPRRLVLRSAFMAIAAAMAGAACHGGLFPVTKLPLAAADAAAPALRFAAAARTPLLFLISGDGRLPHCQTAAWRAAKALHFYEPACAGETGDCIAAALHGNRPSALVLISEPVPTLVHPRLRAARGATVEAGPDAGRTVTLLATGIDLHAAYHLRARLANFGVDATIVSMPCWACFAEQHDSDRAAVLGAALRAACAPSGGAFGWERWLRPSDLCGDGPDTLLPAILRRLAEQPVRAGAGRRGLRAG